MKAYIRAVDYFLPAKIVTNKNLVEKFPDYTEVKIEEKTGIAERHITNVDECASDLALHAAQKLFASGVCQPSEIDFLIFCTQSPDYFLPTTACLLQERLGIPNTAGAFDFNLGCSGYIYGLSIAKGLIETNQAKNVLLLTGETYSKFIAPEDKSTLTIFGDGGAATFIQGIDSPTEGIGPFVFGTDGKGAKNLIVAGGGLRNREPTNLYMNGPEIFAFTFRSIPLVVADLLQKAQLELADIDLFVFHQANKYMLDHLRDKIGIPAEKFCLSMKNYGNTVSSTIPIVLSDLSRQKVLKQGQKIMLVGFGVGYSWGATLIKNMVGEL